MPHAPCFPLSLPQTRPGGSIYHPPGSADALALARLAGRQPLVVVTAKRRRCPALPEIPWFAPDLRVRLLPDWETPTTISRPTTTWFPEAATPVGDPGQGHPAYCWCRRRRRGALAPTSFPAAHTFAFKGRSWTPRPSAASDPGRLHPSPRWCRRGILHPRRLIDLFPMGSTLHPSDWICSTNEIESIRTFDIDTQRTLYPVPEICHPGEFPMDDKGAHRLPPALPRGVRG